MDITYQTKFGEITLRSAMLETDGTNLESGVEIKLDDDLIGEVYGDYSFDEETPIKEIEKFVQKHCDI